MKFIITCCLLVMVTATKNQKISLEDIEHDNLKSEKSTGTVLTKTPINFVPYKTAQDYIRQQPREEDLQHQQQHVKQNVSPPPQIRYQPQQQQKQYQTVPQFYYQQQQQQQQQKQYQTVPQFYYQQPVQQSNYQQYENVQIINDNSIGQQQQQQQQYQPQYYTRYVYLQQYPSPSTSIQTVVDPKNGLQYIMYIPTYIPKSEQTQNYETVVYPEQQPQQQYSEDTQYVVQQQQQQPQQQVQAVQYVEEPQAKTRYFSAKHEPKSLLDSYVPSILQLQYYKQQQQQNQANSIESLYKTTQQTGKIEYRKTRPQASESTTNLNYYIPSH